MQSHRARLILGSISAVACLTVIAAIAHEEISFRRKLAESNQQMRALGGGFTNGRRDAVTWVRASCSEPTFDDQDVPAVVAILKDWERGGQSTRHGIELPQTNVSDHGLELLESLNRLDWIDVSHTHVTPQGIARLQRVFPNVEIRNSPKPALEGDRNPPVK